jgi:hypothetical protein
MDCISLQAPCQIFVRHLALVGWPISLSFLSDVCANLIYLTCHNVLPLVMFAVFRILDSIKSYDQSKDVTGLNEFECSNF